MSKGKTNVTDDTQPASAGGVLRHFRCPKCGAKKKLQQKAGADYVRPTCVKCSIAMNAFGTVRPKVD